MVLTYDSRRKVAKDVRCKMSDGSRDSLLDSPIAQECIKEDMITYFKVMFVSPGGWNLRNLVSHGLMPAGSFNRMMSDRVVHAILVLSLFKPATKV